jgi:iron complex outermembrane receptor protein
MAKTHYIAVRRSLLATALLSALGVLPAYALDGDNGLADLSLQELADLPVTSVSKRSEPLSDAAASIYVITDEAIRRSGARNLPEALRLAPNLQVAQVHGFQWAITARGTNGTAADKLQVLIDGRIVYTPLFSGTLWDAQIVMLEDIDRIEVISGPGGTLWGTNAVNGVINIITKKSQDSQGGLASAGGGRYGADADARYGGKLGETGSYRVYGMVSDTYATDTVHGTPLSAPPAAPDTSLNDGYDVGQVGFRSDWQETDQRYSLQGNVYHGSEEQLDLPQLSRGDLSGDNLTGSWDQHLASGSDLSLLAYYDETYTSAPASTTETLKIGDIQVQQTLPEIYSQQLVWGASYRYSFDDITPGLASAYLPAEAHQTWSSVFAQDEAALTSTLRFIFGAQLEHNPYTGPEILPNIRLAWKATPDSLLWGDVSHGERSPSRFDTNLVVPGQPPYVLEGNPDFQSEDAHELEVGWRSQPSATFSYSITAYKYHYMDERSFTLQGAHLEFTNDMTGRTRGIEAWGSWQPLQEWRLDLGVSALHEDHSVSNGALLASISAEGDDPATQWMLRSNYDFAGGQEFDVDVRRVGALPNPQVPAYTAVDLRYGWPMGEHLEASALLINAIGPTHVEFGQNPPESEFGRGLYFKLTWRP